MTPIVLVAPTTVLEMSLVYRQFRPVFPQDVSSARSNEPPARSGVPRNFVRGGGGSTNSVEDRGQRERGSGGGGPQVRGFGGSCNLVQEISFHIVKFC